MVDGTTPIVGGRLHLPVPSRRIALLLGVVVTFLWATSVVLIRIGVSDEDIAPIGFAAVRFGLAGLLLLPLAIPAMRGTTSWEGGRHWLGRVVLYGLMLFCVAQIGFYVAAVELPVAMIGLLMAISPVVTALVALPSAHERASALQLVGIVVLVVGVAAYFGLEAPDADAIYLIAGIAIPIFVGGGAFLGRSVAVDSRHYGGPLGMTSLAMLVGAGTTLAIAIVTEGVPSFSLTAWGLILWMAAVNTALTYTLWAQTQRRLRAVEASVLGDLTIIMIAILGWLVLDETLTLIEVAGIALVLAGVVLVQLTPILRGRRAPASPELGTG